MPYLLIIAAVALLYWALKNGHIKLDSGQVGQLARTMGGYALVGLAITFLTTGKILMAIPAGLGGLWLMGYLQIKGLKNWAGAMTAPGGSQIINIGIDPASGRIAGQVLSGPFAGRLLDSLSRAESVELAAALMQHDPAALRLFAVYLDGRFPGWREDLQGGADAGAGRQARPGVMSDQEAHKILGLGAGADEATIREAHRRLILKLHPDMGGSDTLAALVNEAKDVLLRRHR